MQQAVVVFSQQLELQNNMRREIKILLHLTFHSYPDEGEVCEIDFLSSPNFTVHYFRLFTI
jgi:hypothetical protein